MKMSNVALALSGVVFGGVLLSSHASAAEGAPHRTGRPR